MGNIGNPQEFVSGLPTELKPLAGKLSTKVGLKLNNNATATKYNKDLTAGIDPLQKMSANIIAQMGRGKDYGGLGGGGLTQGINPTGDTISPAPTVSPEPSPYAPVGGPSPYGGIYPTPSFSPPTYGQMGTPPDPYTMALRAAMRQRS